MPTTLRISLPLFFIGLAMVSCQLPAEGIPSNIQLALPDGTILRTQLAITPEEQRRGLSGVSSKQFAGDQAMLFVYPQKGWRSFWMPNTYFNLDIFFLDGDLKVLYIERNLTAHPGHSEPPPIQRTKSYLAQHVLEMRADSSAARKLKAGMALRWISPTSLSQIISSIHRRQ